jgi:hypothetical protein
MYHYIYIYISIVQVADDENPPDDGHLGVTGAEVQFYGQTFKLCTDGLVSLTYSPVAVNVHSYLQSTKALCGQDGGSRACRQSPASAIKHWLLYVQRLHSALAFGTNLTPISTDRLTVLSGCPYTEHALLCPQQPAEPHRTAVKSNWFFPQYYHVLMNYFKYCPSNHTTLTNWKRM